MKLYFLVCFDISDNKVRQRIGKVLLHYGHRVQHSVFEIALSNTGEMNRLKKSLVAILKDENELRFYRLCTQCRKSSLRIDDLPLATFSAAVIL
ncbi:MAG: CRISPR-associated endonuclease Cas2 [Mariprofundus sp.]|nr:CRISPR-associated endonuclease Cas2 [Mariprofundus sp.]